MEKSASDCTDLQALVASLADNKYFLGRRYAEWCTSAPSLESAVAAASMAQDEIGHARSLYPMLEDVSGESTESVPETRSQYCHAIFLNTPFAEWTDFVAVNFLFDTAISVGLEAAEDSSHTGLAQRARRILEEERLHWLHAEGWIRRLSSIGIGVHGDLQDRLSAVMPYALDWFDLATPDLTRDGTLSAQCDTLRTWYRDRVNPVLISNGLEAA